MDISGKLTTHLPTQSGEGKNGTWQKSGFVIETSNEKFPKRICFTTWGETIAQAQVLQPGEEVKVFFDLESREYQGKWYSDIKAWKVERAGTAPANSAPSSGHTIQNNTPMADTPAITINTTQDDDLPF
jgi:hypothetical protein